MNSALARRIFEAGAKVRNPSLFRQYDYLKSTEWLSRKELKEIQLSNAQQLLVFCAEHSPFYRKLFRERGFNPHQISDLSDLSKLPSIGKQTLISENASIHCDGITERVRLAETSGTSGEALAFYRNESWDSLNRAALMRSYDWYGVKPWENNGYLWGYNIKGFQSKKVAALDLLQNRFRLFKYSEPEIRRFSQRLKRSSFISGYSSMIYEVAKIVNELGLGPLPLKLVKGTSEMILDAYHPETLKAFGRGITCEYGAAESGLIAFECPHGGIHVNIENVLLEQDDDGLLVTNLWSYAFPIIRYRLGDVVTMTDEVCSCGRQHPLLKHIIGRKGANVIGSEQVYPALTFYYVFKNLALEKGILLNYKALQRVKGEVEIFIEGRTNDLHQKDLEAELDKYFGSDVAFDILYVNGFENEIKKRQYFESKL